jgi:hypothetical protein
MKEVSDVVFLVIVVVVFVVVVLSADYRLLVSCSFYVVYKERFFSSCLNHQALSTNS